MKIYILDCEVFEYDWTVDLIPITPGATHIFIHNNTPRLREILKDPDVVVGGFNNKHYDDYILMAILLGASNSIVKKLNDWIIQDKKAPWEFPFLKGQKKLLKSFDLKDDTADPNLSLKAIMGNLGLNIVECSIPWNLNRPLTKAEIITLKHYNGNDTDGTRALWKVRKSNYLDPKIQVSKMYGLDPSIGIGLTNAKLGARVLKAKLTKRSDERDYEIPKEIDVSKIPKIALDFYLQIRDKSIPDAKLFGDGKGKEGLTLDFILKTGGGSTPIRGAWGGIHGAPVCITLEATEDTVIYMDDVESLYPSSMVNFGYTSRSTEDPDAFAKLLNTRLSYKREAKKLSKELEAKLGKDWYKPFESVDEDGDPITWKTNLKEISKHFDAETFKQIEAYATADDNQGSLKLVINSNYGAMLNPYNDLLDKRNGRSVCITNQLAMLMLITMLAEEVSSIYFFNVNTDGLGYTVHKSEVDKVDEIIAKWSEATRFKMERTSFKKFIQKDVNNYVGITDGGKLKAKGAYVNLWNGGNFKSNSLVVVHRAVVEYLVNGIDPGETINKCTNILDFQQIVKTGGSYEGSYQYINGVRKPIQNVNRIYAVKASKYPNNGRIVKGKLITEKRKKNKLTGKYDVFKVDPPVWQETEIDTELAHPFIDNANELSIEDLDKDYYIAKAKDRINKFLHPDKKVLNQLKKIKEEVVIMATEKKEVVDTTKLNIYQKLIKARAQFLESGIKKGGVNRYAEFKYYTLDDIVPIKTKIFKELGLVDVVTFDIATEITSSQATLKLINVDNPQEEIYFTSQLDRDESLIKNPIQKVGAIQTYIRRYLYLLALDIVEADAIEATTGQDDTPKEAPKKATKKPLNNEERKEVKEELINKEGEISPTQEKAIKNGLKKLREKSDDNEPYIKDIVKKLKAKTVDKKQAEAILIEIGEKLNA